MKQRKKRPRINVMQRRGLVKRGVPLRTRKGRPSTVFRKQPELVPVEKAPKKTPSYKRAGEAGRKIITAENRARRKAGQNVRVMFEPEFARKLRVVKVEGQTLYIHPSGYLPYFARVRFAETLTPKQKAVLAKRGRLLSTMPFLIGAGAGVLSLGQKYILIPKRPTTVGVHPGKFHWVSGMADWYMAVSGRKHEKPPETAAREAAEEVGEKYAKTPAWFTAEKVAKEVGAAKSRIQFLGQGLRTVKAEKAPALIMLQDLNINMFEVQHAVDIKTSRPNQFIGRYFERIGSFEEPRLKGGLYQFRKDAKVKDKWEMEQAAIITRDSKSIFLFLKSHRGQVTEPARLGLLAYAAELRKIERAKKR